MYLYGASGHCKVIIDIIKSSTSKQIEAVFDDFKNSNVLEGIPILKFNKTNFNKENELIISIGNNKLRKKIADKIKPTFITAIHNSAIISKTSIIEKGTVIMPKVVVNAAAIIGQHCIINTSAIVEHECVLEDFVHVSPNSTLCGNVKIGEGTHIGAGVTIIPGIKIGKWCTIGAGSVVVKDMPDNVVAVGNPAKVIKVHK